MSVLYIDSFDDRATVDLNSRSVRPAVGSLIQAGGQCNTQCYTNNTVGGGIVFGVDSAGSAVAQVGCAFSHGTGVSPCQPLFIAAEFGTNAIMAFLSTNDSGAPTPNSVNVFTGPNGILGTNHFTSGAGTLPTDGSYVYLELRVLFDDLVGEIDFWLDGVNLFSTTGIDTINFFSPGLPWSTFGVGSTNGTGRCVDDMYAMNDVGPAPTNATVSLPGSVGASGLHVVAILPQTDAVGGGMIRDWTPSTGADHGAMVDETPPNNDVDYVETLVEGQEETFRFPLIDVVASDVVFAVQSGIYARKDDIGNSNIITIAKEGANPVVDGVEWGVSAEDYYSYIQMWDPPSTALPWTLTKVATVEWGMRHTRVRS